MLAKLLKSWGIKPTLNNSKGARGTRGYAKASFARLWKDYLG